MVNLSLGALSVAYDLDGPDNAPTVVLAHCFVADRDFWRPHLTALAGFQVLRFDARGHGETSRPDGPYSIDDMTDDNGPVLFAPGTHRGPVYDHLSNGYFCGAVAADVARSLAGKYDTLTGTAGTVTFHHARLLHASLGNQSGSPRRFLLYEVMAADAWPLAGCSASFESFYY